MRVQKGILIAALLLLACLQAAQAKCSVSMSPRRYLSTADSNMARIPIGTVNLGDDYLQTPGTLLASTVAPSSLYTFNSVQQTSVLWVCDAADLPNVYFLVATNGDEIYSGYWDGGPEIGMTDVYGTFFHYVGIKMTMSGVPVSRYWRAVPLTTYAIVGKQLQIRLMDIPPMQVELYKLRSLPPTSGTGNICGRSGTPLAPPGRLYTCRQPNAYIQLKGPGIDSDNVGEDSSTKYRFWYVNNGFGYSLWNSASLTQQAGCRVSLNTKRVTFPPISVAELQQGAYREQPFWAQLECSVAAKPGTETGQVAVGIQASPGAYEAAKQLGYVNSANGVDILVSDHYGVDDALAKGVGVKIRNSAGESITLVGQPGLSGAIFGQGERAGWYSALLHSTSDGASSRPGYSLYTQNYMATLSALPGQPVAAGRYHANAYVLVRLQ